jgi:hypothetical protein
MGGHEYNEEAVEKGLDALQKPGRIRTFWQWLVDKYGYEEAKRRYEIWRKTPR